MGSTAMPNPEMPLKDEEHEQCGRALFNFVWTLLEKPHRSPQETDLMIHACHAMWLHWSKVGKPVNFARAEWQLARVYAVAGLPERARHHGQHCLEICQANRLGSFDLADTDSSCAVRFVTTVPTTSLTMLNSKFFNDQAHVLALRLKEQAGNSPAKQVQLALNLVMARKPTASEVQQGVAFMKDLQTKEGVSADKALDYFCLVALNLNEFLYLD